MADPREEEIETVEDDAPEIETEDAPETEVETPEPDREALEAEARKLGWKPKEEWKGDTSRWTDADEFVERNRYRPERINQLESKLEAREREVAERLQRMERYYENRAKREREQLQQQMMQAVETGDVETFKKLDAQREQIAEPPKQQATGPAPEVQEWVARNQWFEQDTVMRAAATALSDDAYRKGITDTRAQLAYVDERMRERFPDKFSQPKRKATVSAVDSGGVMPAPRQSMSGWSNIPAEERAVMRKDIAAGTFKDEADAAKSYWAEYGR